MTSIEFIGGIGSINGVDGLSGVTGPYGTLVHTRADHRGPRVLVGDREFLVDEARVLAALIRDAADRCEQAMGEAEPI